MHLADLGIRGAHPMGYAPVSKVLSTYTRVEERPLPLAQPEDVLVIHRGQPQVGHHHQHRHRHHARHERVGVLHQRVLAQNRVALRVVSPMTIAEYKIMRKWVKIMKLLYCLRKRIINRIPFRDPYFNGNRAESPLSEEVNPKYNM